MQRYFLEKNLQGPNLILPKDIFHHAITVMRMRVGAKFEVVTPDEFVNIMEVTEIKGKVAKAKLVSKSRQTVEMPKQAVVVCGLSKGDKAEWIVQKGTEMGAAKFIFFQGDYSVAKWDQKKQKRKLERLYKIAQGAAEQSHRTQVPAVEFVAKVADLELPATALGLVAYEEEAKQGEKTMLMQTFENLRNKDALWAVFGPEGGLAPKEVETLLDKGFVKAGLGPRIMRAETAPLYFLASMSFYLELTHDLG